MPEEFDARAVLASWSVRRAQPWSSTPAAGLSTRAQLWLVGWTAWVVLALTGAVVRLFGGLAGSVTLFGGTTFGCLLVAGLWARLARRHPVSAGFAEAHTRAVELALAFRSAAKGRAQAAAAAFDAHLGAHPELYGGCWRREFHRIWSRGLTPAA